VVLFGGDTGHGDNSGSVTESLVYDPATKTAIMFGGFSSDTGRLGDTWSWNGTTWTRLHPAANPGPEKLRCDDLRP
jgi:hypothetical protein